MDWKAHLIGFLLGIVGTIIVSVLTPGVQKVPGSIRDRLHTRKARNREFERRLGSRDWSACLWVAQRAVGIVMLGVVALAQLLLTLMMPRFVPMPFEALVAMYAFGHWALFVSVSRAFLLMRSIGRAMDTARSESGLLPLGVAVPEVV